MKRLLTSIAFMIVLTVTASAHAGEVVSDSTADIQQVLDRLRGTSGLYGATSTEMGQFIDMIDTPELAAITARLRVQLEERGDTDTLTLEEVSHFVSQNFTLADAASILGRSVRTEEFQRGVQSGRDSQNLDMLVNMLGKK